MLSAPVPCERFEPIRGRRAQVDKITRLMQHVELAQALRKLITRLMQHVELAQSLLFDAAKALYALAHPQAFGGALTERPDHATLSTALLIIRQAYNVSRRTFRDLATDGNPIAMSRRQSLSG